MWNFGGETSFSQSKTKSKTSPWGPQAAQLQNAFAGAEALYNQGPYTGRYTSTMGPMEQNMMQNAYGYYNPGGAGYQAQVQQQNFANQAMSALPQAMQMYTDIYGNPITTQSITDNMNQDLIDAQSKAAQDAVGEMLMATQNTNDSAGMSSGNLGSSKQAQVQAQAANDAANDLANQYNSIYNQQYMNTQNLMQNQQQMGLGVAGAMTGIGQMGSQANMQAQDMYNQGIGIQSQMADRERAQADREIENQLGQAYAGWDWLDRYMNIIGSNNWGSESSSKTTNFDQKLTGSFGM